MQAEQIDDPELSFKVLPQDGHFPASVSGTLELGSPISAKRHSPIQKHSIPHHVNPIRILLMGITDRNFLFQPLGSLPAEGPGSVGVRSPVVPELRRPHSREALSKAFAELL